MNEELLAAFDLIYDTCVLPVQGEYDNDADQALHKLAEIVLTDDEYVEFSDGYTKDGIPVIK